MMGVDIEPRKIRLNPQDVIRSPNLLKKSHDRSYSEFPEYGVEELGSNEYYITSFAQDFLKACE